MSGHDEKDEQTQQYVRVIQNEQYSDQGKNTKEKFLKNKQWLMH